MSVIDSRVVEMGFDNTKFGAGVQGTIGMLDKLKSSLGMQGAAKGLEGINEAAKRFDSSTMEQGVGRIAGSFTALQATAFGALANIGAKISNVAINTSKAFTLEPIKAGFDEYELKMGSIQTILANTARQGTKLKDVDDALEELNKYSDQTIYNFGDMTKNIGLFTNAGLKLNESVAMIKGFSNAAAASGTNAEGAAHAAQQLSQGLSAGTITAQDWISLTNVGMGNKNMQLGLIEIAKSMDAFDGKTKDAGDATKNFKGSLEGKWLSADVMSLYLQAMTGDMTNAELAAKGLDKATIKMLQKQAKIGFDSATKVRTFTQLMGVLKETVGSGWSETFGILIGDFDTATELFTGLNNSIGGWLGKIGAARNEILQEFVDKGGREKAIHALTDAFWGLARIFIPIGRAFKDTFASMNAGSLLNMVDAFQRFADAIYPSRETMELIQRSFQGLFGILGIGWLVIKEVAGFLADLFMGLEEGDKGILKVTASIGDFFWNLYFALKEGKSIQQFFDQLFKLVFKVINPIKDFGQVIGNVFAGLDMSGVGTGLGKFISDLLYFGEAADKTGEKVEKSISPLKRFWDFLKNMAFNVGDFVAPIAENIAGMFEGIDYDQIIDAFQTGMLGGLVVVIKQLGGVFKGLSIFGGDKDAGPGIVDKIKDSLDGLSGTLSAMQANLKASMLLKIAAAVAALAISVVLLAGVDAKGLARATAALTAMFIQLAVAMQVFQKIGTVASIAKLNLMGAALILLGVAILILSSALRVISKMSWEELAKGLGALGIMIGLLIVYAKALDKAKGQFVKAAFSMIIMGGALHVLVSVIERLGELDLITIAKGIGSIAALLVGLALFTKMQKSAKDALAQGAALLFLAIALRVMVEVVKLFGEMDWEVMGKGFAGLAGGLIAVGVALKFMPQGPQMLLTAFGIGKVATAFMLIAKAFAAFDKISWTAIAKGLVAISGAMVVAVKSINKLPKIGAMQILSLLGLAYAVKQIVGSMVLIGEMDTEQVGKALVVFGGVLAMIVTALNMMKGTAEGAGSIAAVAASFEFLGGILTEWGKMSYEQLGKGIGTMAAVLTILAVSLSLLKTEAAGAAALGLVAGAMSLLIPTLVALGSMPIVAIAAALVGLAGMFAVLVLGLKLLAPVLPVLAGMAGAIALLGLATALAGVGLLAFSAGLSLLAVSGAAGVAALVAAVSAVVGLIPMVAEQIGLGIVALLTAIGNSGAALTEALVKILSALLDAIIRLVPKLGATLLVLLNTGLQVLLRAVPMLVDAGLKLITALLRGIANNIGKMVDAAADIIVNFINGISRNLPKIIQAGIDLILAFVNGLADGIRKNSEAMGRAGGNLASALVEGMVNGIAGGLSAVVDAAKRMASSALDAAKEFLGIASPSKEFAKLGKFAVQGFAKGLMGSRSDINNAVKTLYDQMNTALAKNRDVYKAANKRREELRAQSRENLRDYHDAEKALAKARAKGENTDAERRRLHKLLVARKKITSNIQEQTKLMQRAHYENVKVTKARTALQKSLDDETSRLKKYADAHDKIKAKIESATEALKDAKATRDDYRKSLMDQFGAIPEVDAESKLTDYVSSLEKQIIDTQKFGIAIQELRKRGLNDEMYQQLLAKGPDVLPFLTQMLEGGTAAIDQINYLGNALDKEADKIAYKGSYNMYQAGVDAATGILKGLEKQEDNIVAVMDRIADKMVATIKAKLAIKSPSRVFAKMGVQTAQGLAKGMDDTAVAVGRSAEAIGDTAVAGLRESLSNVTTIMSSDMDLNPVIAPVLDLSNVRKGSGTIGDLLTTQPLSVNAAYSGAVTAATTHNVNREATAAAQAGVPVSETIVFEQHNHSPKALSAIEIYRQTNNQLSVARGALTNRAR